MILAEGVIRKISIGENLKDSMVYEVGKKAFRGEFTISKIEFSNIESFMYDSIILHIYCTDKVGEFVWKTFCDFKNLSIEYER